MNFLIISIFLSYGKFLNGYNEMMKMVFNKNIFLYEINFKQRYN